MDTKRLTSTRYYSISNDGKLVLVDNSSIHIETANHIVILWYQFIHKLIPSLKISKQYLKDISREICLKYIRTMNNLFDFSLYKDYESALISQIPEFVCPLEESMLKLFSIYVKEDNRFENILELYATNRWIQRD